MESVSKFVQTHTAHFDKSHDFNHAVAVLENLNRLLLMERFNGNNIALDEELLRCVALLHDVCDHKYKSSITKQQLEEFLTTQVGADRSKFGMELIENISYSKQAKGECKIEHFTSEQKLSLDLLRDSDRIEAIGTVGIKRCTQFVLSRGGKVPEDVIQHCHEKLLKLYPDYFIATDSGRLLAEPLHNQIVDYVRSVFVS